MVKGSCFKLYLMIRKLLLLFLVAIIPTLIFGQAPGADCGSATALALVPGGTISTGLQTTATLGDTYAVGISCTVGSGFYGDATDGVYSINVTSGGDYTFAFANTGSTWKSLSIHSGCAPTNGNCVGGIITGGLQDGTTGPITLTPGTYYLVVDSWAALTPSASFTLEITSPIANDDPCGAIPLSVNIPCSFTTSTTTNATDSAGIPAPGCANYNGGDVWFTTTVPASGTIIVDTNTGIITDSGMAIYSVVGLCPTPVLTLIECDDDDSANGLMSSITSTGLTPGDTIYIRVWEYGNDNPGTFDICVSEPPGPPANDDPCNAEPLSVNSPCSFSTYTNESATGSVGVPAPGCAGYSGGDVWFSVTVPASGGIIIDTDTGVITDSGMAIYSGACGGLTLIECDDDDSSNGFGMSSITRTGLTPGDTIYIRVWEFGNNNNGTFDICVTEPPPPPTNTDCASATDINCGQSIFATTNGVTGSAAHGTGCTMSDYGVWYHFVGDGNIVTIDVTPNGSYDTEIAVLSGSCGSLTNISCQDGFGTDSFSFTSVNLTDYYVYVAHYAAANTSTGDFTINLTCTPPNCTPGPGTGISPLGLPNLVAVDTNGNNPAITSCGVIGSIDLEASYLQLGDPSDYSVSTIPYSPPYQFDCLANQFSTFNDDTWAPVVNMSFDFCFYDNVAANAFSQFQANANGVMSFDSFTPGSNCGYVNDWNVPSAINADGLFGTEFYGRSIYGVHHDINPSQGGEVGYETITLDTGERALIMSWSDIPMFSNNSILYTGMIVLYEHSNVIEVYIEEKNIDNNNVFPWNDGNATVAIQDDATTGMAAPNRNSLDANWNTTQEAWRFTPTGGGLGSISNFTWYEGSASANGNTTTGLVSLGNNDIITVAPASDTIYTAEVEYNFCDGTSMTRFEEILVQVSSTKIWDGSEATDNWMDPLNWSDGTVPTAVDCVIIPVTGNDPVVYDDNNGDGLNLTIETGATLTLTSDSNTNNLASTLTIQDFIDIQGTGLLTVQDDASLIQVYDSSTSVAPSAANTGNIVLNRNTEIRRTDYVYWSSPVQNYNVSNVYGAFTPLSYIYQWTPTVPTGTFTPGVLPTGGMPICYGNWALNSSATMNLGKGYIVRGPTNHTNTITTATSVFTGVPNNGVITHPISSGTNSFAYSNYAYNPYGTDVLTVTPFDDNWNLLGNPYPSALDAQSFLSHPSNNIIEGAVHVWTHGSQIGTYPDSFYDDFFLTYNVLDYITYNFSGTNTYQDESFQGKIGSGQGFFVLALNDSEAGSVTFNNSMRDRSHSNTAFYRTANEDENIPDSNAIERNRIWLNLVDQNGSTSSILVGYIEGATQEKDRLFDAYIREVNSLSIYSKIGDQRMIIQGRSLPFDENDQVPLGAVIPDAGEYTIAINNVDGLFLEESQTIYLEDTYTGVIHNLRAAPYTFIESEAIDYEDRFILRYTVEALSINELELGTGLTIIAPKNNYIKVNSEQGLIESVIVYDLLGRVLFDKNSINESEFILNNHNFSSGTYIVKATLANGQSKAQKIVLTN